jgi:hypothetical protein
MSRIIFGRHSLPIFTIDLKEDIYAQTKISRDGHRVRGVAIFRC